MICVWCWWSCVRVCLWCWRICCVYCTVLKVCVCCWGNVGCGVDDKEASDGNYCCYSPAAIPLCWVTSTQMELFLQWGGVVASQDVFSVRAEMLKTSRRQRYRSIMGLAWVSRDFKISNRNLWRWKVLWQWPYFETTNTVAVTIFWQMLTTLKKNTS